MPAALEETKVDETKQVEDEVKEVPSTETKKTDDHMIPKSRFDDVNQKYKDAIKRADAFEKTAQEAETKRLKASEDYRALYEAEQAKVIELQPKADGADSALETLKDVLATQIESIPEDKRSLIPDKMSTEDQLEWIGRNRGLLSKSQPMNVGAGIRGGTEDKNSVALSPEQRTAAKKAGVTEEAYANSIDKEKAQ